jgi:hypothetical protein
VTQQIIAIFAAAWLVTVLLLLLEHTYLRGLPRLWRYTIGTAAICLGLNLIGLLVEDVYLLVAPWFIASAGGVVVGAYAIRGMLKERDRQSRRSGEIVGMARGLNRELTQEIIDTGGFRAESDLGGAGRKN